MEELDLLNLSEQVDLECKKAAGRDGRGEVPKGLWPSYAAMANTEGGKILLGVEELEQGSFQIIGIVDLERVKKSLWDGLNNKEIISDNLLSDKDIRVISAGGKSVLQINVPRASRTQKPVYIGSNPMTGTYRRNYEGDYRCDEEAVRRMMAERVSDSRDAAVLEGYTIEDLDAETLKVYRGQFQTVRPSHPWNGLPLHDYLRNLGAWGVDRQRGTSGVTLAGVLMFGRLRPILDACPNYVVDYQERPEAKREMRWVDRVTTDGTWSGNLFDFYRLVITRLVRDLRVPFRLQGQIRIDDTPVHEALREALTNALIHADYSGRVSVLVVKRPDLFGFRNPGGLRIPQRAAIQGGTSDCRNRNLQKMFQLVGFGEQAGSGIPKIYHNWRLEDWRPPVIEERRNPDQTIMTLRMVSLLPDSVVVDLDTRIGERFRRLPEVQRLALATASLEGSVTHSRLAEISDSHPHDLSRDLHDLVEDGMLESAGIGRGTVYYLPGSGPAAMDEFAVSVADAQTSRPNAEHLPTSPEHLPQSPEHLPQSPEHLITNPEHLPGGRRRADHAQMVSEKELASLAEKVVAIAERKKVPSEEMERAILTVCAGRFLSLRELRNLLHRSADTLRTHYLSKMVDQGRLKLLFPERPSHPRQRYTAATVASEKK